MATYVLKRKTFAFGFGALSKAFKGMTSASTATRLKKVIEAGHGNAKIAGTTATQALENTKNLQKSVGSNLTKGLMGVGATAAVGAGAIGAANGTFDTFTGNVGNDSY